MFPLKIPFYAEKLFRALLFLHSQLIQQMRNYDLKIRNLTVSWEFRFLKNDKIWLEKWKKSRVRQNIIHEESENFWLINKKSADMLEI